MDALTPLMNYLQQVNIVSIAFRFILAIIIGGMIGIDREVKRLPAGMKTHQFVCLGAVVVMVTAQYITQTMGYGGDVTRMSAQVISGIGFLGAGTIMVTPQNTVKGLTTAAGLWCSACIGLAIGIGFYSGVILAMVAVFLVLKVTPRIEAKIYKKAKVLNLYIELEDVLEISEVIQQVKQCKCKIVDVNIGKIKFSGIHGASIQMSLFLDDPAEHSTIVSSISKIKSLRFIEEVG